MKTDKKIVTDAAVDTAFTAGTVWISAAATARASAILGSVFGPAGTLIGMAVGMVIGYGIYYWTDVKRFNGKTARRWVKDYANAW